MDAEENDLNVNEIHHKSSRRWLNFRYSFDGGDRYDYLDIIRQIGPAYGGDWNYLALVPLV